MCEDAGEIGVHERLRHERCFPRQHADFAESFRVELFHGCGRDADNSSFSGHRSLSLMCMQSNNAVARVPTATGLNVARKLVPRSATPSQISQWRKGLSPMLSH